MGLFKNVALAIPLFILFNIFPPLVISQNAFNFAQSLSPLDSTINIFPRHQQSLGVKKFINSFTSYQFPNPFPPSQDPLSRLEFPIDQWFIGASSQYMASSWSLLCQGWLNLSRESALKMQDSDWDDESMPKQKTIFSESGCRLNRGLILDACLIFSNIFDNFPVMPVIGARYQNFFFTTHDGYQVVFGGEPIPLPGDGIEFKQVFYHYYFGASFSNELNLFNIMGFLPRLAFLLQVDYGLVRARNEDLHLLREGERITIENTKGHCWHIAGTVTLFRLGSFNMKCEADFKRIVTDGSHQLSNSFFPLDFSFDGSRVWSDQMSLSAIGELIF